MKSKSFSNNNNKCERDINNVKNENNKIKYETYKLILQLENVD